MKKFFIVFTMFLTFLTAAFATETYTLKGGVSIEKVPKDFYGSWRVTSKLQSSNNPEIFKKSGVDLWNLSRVHDVISLENPFSGAQASITLDEVRGNFIRFNKVGNYDGKKLTDSVSINLAKESFSGVNTLKLDTISEIDGHVMKSESAIYTLVGEKISGSGIK